MERWATSGDSVIVTGLLFVISLRLVGAQMFSATLDDPKLNLRMSQCRETCGNKYFECKIGKCESGDFGSEEGYGLCIDLCTEIFYACLNECERKITPAPTTTPPTVAAGETLPPGVYELIRNLHNTKGISGRNSVLNDNTVNSKQTSGIELAGKDYLNRLSTVKPFSFTGIHD
ncbi:uncharacterized protein LOC117323572 [Pecten maximus]|uniref:uncharacterized protein LOC117323572 n=1 Tax=Pecten maximus TaxID=6579 RepID=UPI001458E341|nr:uncharacterized protein LOC117323572 [Pecten maximus]